MSESGMVWSADWSCRWEQNGLASNISAGQSSISGRWQSIFYGGKSNIWTLKSFV